MGSIDLDPCSEAKFEQVVRAARSYSLLDRGEDGLLLPWAGHVFCNPPGGTVAAFWCRAFAQSAVEQMFWVGFSVEQLCLLADEQVHPLDFSTCILRKRIPFERHDGYQGSPSHGNYVTLVNGSADTFEREFAPLGKVVHGRYVRHWRLKVVSCP